MWQLLRSEWTISNAVFIVGIWLHECGAIGASPDRIVVVPPMRTVLCRYMTAAVLSFCRTLLRLSAHLQPGERLLLKQHKQLLGFLLVRAVDICIINITWQLQCLLCSVISCIREYLQCISVLWCTGFIHHLLSSMVYNIISVCPSVWWYLSKALT